MPAPTIDFFKAWCRVDGDEFDAILPDLIAAATDQASNETGNDYTTVEMPSSVKMWCALQVGHWLKNAESTTEKTLVKTPYIDGLLDPYRQYTMEVKV